MTKDREIIISRDFDAPREVVFSLFKDPKKLAKWWGPNGFTITTSHMEFKAKGSWKFLMHGPDGVDYPNKVVYTEILEPQRIIYEHFGEEGGDAHFYARITFEEIDGKTRVTLTSVFKTKEERDVVVEKYGAIEGGRQTLERLGFELKKLNGIEVFEITKVYSASREKVFEAFSKKEQFSKWWGPEGFEFISKRFEFREGGLYHHGMKGKNGEMMWGKIRYIEIFKNEKICFVDSFSDENENIVRADFSKDFPLEMYVIITLSEVGGKTTLNLRNHPLGATESEMKFFKGMFDSMNQGYGSTFEQLRKMVE